MKIISLKIYQLSIPFSLAISHNLAKRQESEAILVVAESDDGFIGLGEGTPRHYVTNETLSGCVDGSLAIGKQLLHQEWNDFAGLNTVLDSVSNTSLAKRNPSAWCALELACLDLLAKSIKVPLWRLFADTPVQDSFTHSAVIPFLSSSSFNPILEIIQSLDMQFVKVKVSNDLASSSYLTTIRNVLGPEVDLRIDANGAFSADEAIAFLKANKSVRISSIEQPVAKDDLEGFRKVTKMGSVATIADESICNENDMDDLIAHCGCSGFNIRLSKCGGFRECLKLWNRALENGFFCQLGCHVGETGVLAAAGRHLMALCRNSRYLEGGYTRFLLESDICNEAVSFGQQGKAGLLEGDGLSVTIKAEALEKWGTLIGELS